ncbi:MAG: hypothetical protein LBF50_10600 [Azoarcus sp.]|jgi:hypothetical protein|nr:hypothetical protein [Azoarcus sp.]
MQCDKCGSDNTRCLAKRAALPEKAPYLPQLVGMVIAFVCLEANGFAWIRLGSLLMALCIYGIYAAFQHNENVWPGHGRKAGFAIYVQWHVLHYFYLRIILK